MEKKFFDDYCGFDFIKLKTGHYACDSEYGVMVSKCIVVDESDGLSDLACRAATIEESVEYFEKKKLWKQY